MPSGTNLAGLLQHLTFVEAKWFEEVAAGRKPTRGRRSMDVDHAVSLRDLRADYRAACDTSNEIISALGDAVRSVHAARGPPVISAAVMLVVIAETARHAGHADIIREQIDGQTGR